MSKYIISILLFLSCLLFIGCATTPKPIGELSEQEIIYKHFKGRDLDPIEGIWVWDNNFFEVAIIKNSFNIYTNYDYVAIIVETHRRGWSVGELKFLVKRTSGNENFLVSYFNDRASKNQVGTTLLLENYNKAILMTRRVPAGRRGITLLRIYPDNSSLMKSTE